MKDPHIPKLSRRTFLKAASTATLGAAVWSMAPRRLRANPLGLPLGLQLYSVRDLLPKDYEGTLHQLAALGYREVEAAGFFDHSAIAVKQMMDRAGLSCISAHYGLQALLANESEIIQYGKDLGLKYIVCSWPWVKDPSKVKDPGSVVATHSMTLDDWRWNAEQLNRIGERVNSAGMRFGYHNHTAEFREQNGVVFYDELLHRTDPARVTMEMDCGWVVAAGKSPVEYLTRYPNRFSMLHVKDFKIAGPISGLKPPPSTELGRGSIDYRPIFAAAKKGKVQHAFVEQEQFDMPPMEALKIDAEYMKAMSV